MVLVLYFCILLRFKPLTVCAAVDMDKTTHSLCSCGYGLADCGMSGYRAWRPQPCRNLYGHTVRDMQVIVRMKGRIV